MWYGRSSGTVIIILHKFPLYYSNNNNNNNNNTTEGNG